MSKEQIIDDAYRKYADSHWTPPSNPKGKLLSNELFSVIPMEHSKETFVNECKTNPEFSERWGLKIEERKLSLEERIDYWLSKDDFRFTDAIINKEDYESFGFPTKLITLEYNGTKIEVYE